MRWVIRLLYNNDKLAIAHMHIGFKVTSIQAIRGEERSIHFSGLSGQKMVFQLLTYRQKWLN